MCRQSVTHYSCHHEANHNHEPCDNPTRPGPGDRSSHLIEKIQDIIHDTPCPNCRPRADIDNIFIKGSNHQRLKNWVKAKLAACFTIDDGESIEGLYGSGSKGSKSKRKMLRKGARKGEWLGERGPTNYGSYGGSSKY